LALTSVAAERLTEIFKKAWLEKANLNSVYYQVIAAVFGFTLALYNPPEIALVNMNDYVRATLVGLAISGGSGIWHDLLITVNNYSKSVKKPTE